MARDRTDHTTIWVAAVGSVAIALVMGFGFWSDTFTDAYTLNFLIPLFLINPVIFAVGAGVAFWRTGEIGQTLIVFGAYLLTFALIWQIATNWFGFSWRNFGAGFTTIGLAALAYLALSALVVVVLLLIRRQTGSAR